MKKQKLEDRFEFRGLSGYRSRIDQVLRENPEKYTSIAHFLRVAVIKLLEKELGEEPRNDD